MTGKRVYLIAGSLLAINYFTLVVIAPRSMGVVSLGYFIGSLFSHAALAAAWSALRPGKLRVRLVLSLLWVFALPVAAAMNIAFHGGPRGGAVMLGGCLFGLWLMMLLLFAGLVWKTGIQLQGNQRVSKATSRQTQFEIRELMALMTASAIVVGVGRLLLPNVAFRGELLAFIFLSISTVVTTLPLIIAALLKRYAVAGVLCALGLIALTSYFQAAILDSLGGSGPGTDDFVSINVSSAVLILMVASVVRLNGFSLYTKQLAAEVAAE